MKSDTERRETRIPGPSRDAHPKEEHHETSTSSRGGAGDPGGVRMARATGAGFGERWSLDRIRPSWRVLAQLRVSSERGPDPELARLLRGGSPPGPSLLPRG